ncbi:MAG TPA: hypothetical protein PKE26_06020 [Kiritimatiellia bacterium]|nr:hypothetical protein [Kiritimatiellia bacterium]HMO98650.1 hypothetical protein [Kiritimatiellia bacterium]HMP91179.1 hypothetical protein [Kiritimatiellia bacterium]
MRLPFVIFAVFLADFSAHAAEYAIINLGTLGGTGSVARAINNRGEVVGWSWNAAEQPEAFVWSGGSLSGLGFLEGGAFSEAYGINDEGVTVGWAAVSATNRHAFRFRNGVLESIGTLGGPNSQGFAINAAGRITGWSQLVTNQPFATDPEAFVFVEPDLYHLPPFHDYHSCEGHAINEEGLVAGITFVFSPNPRWWGYVWVDTNANVIRDAGEMRLLGTLGGEYSGARGINREGQVVGWAVNAAGITRAFLVNPSNRQWKIPDSNIIATNALMRDLGALGGEGASSDAYAVNDYGWVVGSSVSNGQERAFLWRNGIMEDLNALAASSGGWVLRRAYAINNQGEIVGEGTYQGQTRAFLLSREGMITRFAARIAYDPVLVTNESHQVFTQQVSRVERLELEWPATWANAGSSAHFIVQRAHEPGVHPVWEDWRDMGVTNMLWLSLEGLAADDATSAWFRVRTEW